MLLKTLFILLLAVVGVSGLPQDQFPKNEHEVFSARLKYWDIDDNDTKKDATALEKE